jgi:hypothetical protein
VSGPGPDARWTPPEPPARDPIVDYLRAHSGRFTREALETRLRAAGHADAEIDAAWQAVEADPDGPRVPVAARAPGAAETLLAVLAILAALVTYGGSAILALLGASFATSSGASQAPLVLLLYFLGVVIGGIWSMVFVWRRRRAEHAVLAVLGATALSAVLYIVMSGICIATRGGILV